MRVLAKGELPLISRNKILHSQVLLLQLQTLITKLFGHELNHVFLIGQETQLKEIVQIKFLNV